MKRFQFVLTGLCLICSLNLTGAKFAAAQNQEINPDAREEFIPLGLISFSTKYQLAEDGRFIIFTIRNNAGRTINNIYGWVYRYRKGDDEKPENVLLVNNPHRGGVIVKGRPHSPGKLADWRFPLFKRVQEKDKENRFTLRVSPKSLFYSNIETRPKSSPK